MKSLLFVNRIVKIAEPRAGVRLNPHSQSCCVHGVESSGVGLTGENPAANILVCGVGHDTTCCTLK